MPPAHGRIHLEVHLDAPTDGDRLVELGATRAREEPEVRWVLYADPAGNQCRNGFVGRPVGSARRAR